MNLSLTLGTIEVSQHIDKSLSQDQEDMVTLLKWLLNEGIKPTMEEKITTLENIFSLKMETALTQRMPSMVNTQTTDMDSIYDRLQQKNIKLQI